MRLTDFGPMNEAPSFTLDEALGYLIVRVAADMEHAFTELMATVGLTVRQFGILTLLAGGPLTAAEIARRLNVTAQSVGPQIDTLVRRGLVARGPGPGRGRAIDVTLTDEGRQAFRAAGALARQEQARTTGHLTHEEQRDLIDRLREIQRRTAQPRP